MSKTQVLQVCKSEIESVGYYAVVDSSEAKGVIKKIEGVVASCQGLGLSANSCISEESIQGILGFFKALLFTNHKIIFIRFTTMLAPLVCFIAIILRLKGKQIIIDVPTPRRVVLQEVLGVDKSLLYKISNWLVLSLSASWIFWPANLVIQYADESRWFSFGLANKTLKMGNGISISQNTPLRKAKWPDKELILIAVAQLAYWHGFDRVIRAMHILKQEESEISIRFVIAGDGNQLGKLKQLVGDLNLDTQVEFKGVLVNEGLDNAFEKAHVGISSLGLYRKSLSEASDLKTREYLSRGLMVIATGDDIDFPVESELRLEIPNDDSVTDLVNIFRDFGDRMLPDSQLARQYAIEYLSFDAKMAKIFNFLYGRR